jgi:protein required for attachment to host cells
LIRIKELKQTFPHYRWWKRMAVMNEQHTSKPHMYITWVLVADGKQAQVYECRKVTLKFPLGGANKHHYVNEKSGHELVPVSNMALEAESIDDYQIGHDRRGTSSSSNSPTHNTYEPHGDIKEELKRRFTKTIADKLQHACTEKLFDRLVLVAPAKMIGGLREQLAANVRDHIAAVLSKDLTHYQVHELLPHLQDTLAEAQVA